MYLDTRSTAVRSFSGLGAVQPRTLVPVQWTWIDTALLVAGIGTAGYLAWKLFGNKLSGRKRPSRREAELMGSALAVAQNPGSKVSERDIQRAIEQYRGFHWGENPTEIQEYDVDDVPEVVHGLGKAEGILYRTTKTGDGDMLYLHQFDEPQPLLATGLDRKQLHLLGGRYTIEDRGIVH
jgi:hypothetical protein